MKSEENPRQQGELLENSRELDTLLPLSRVAEILGSCSVKTVRRMIDRGELPRPCRVGRRSMLPQSEVEAFIQTLKEERAKRQRSGSGDCNGGRR